MTAISIEPISHRGYWFLEKPEEKNSKVAFERSVKGGWGIETDFRDYKGELVISHDIPKGGEMSLDEFFEICQTQGTRRDLPLALNVKADGLQGLLKPLLEKHGITNYFVFDQSVAQTVVYAREGFKFYVRESEYESDLNHSLYNQAKGVWIDQFESNWITAQAVQKHVSTGKNVCIVSPELHKRPHQSAWETYRNSILPALNETKYTVTPGKVYLCTDLPQEAQSYFNPS